MNRLVLGLGGLIVAILLANAIVWLARPVLPLLIVATAVLAVYAVMLQRRW